MKHYLQFVPLIFMLLTSCTDKLEDSFYEGFVDPPIEAKPFLRWYWSGNHIEAHELLRELDSIKKQGIGGVEIFPVSMPENAKDIGTEPVEWLSEEWNKLLALTCDEAHSRNMIVDLMTGAGWPYGGEWVDTSKAVQRVIISEVPFTGQVIIDESFESLWNGMLQKNRNKSPYVYRDMQNAESNKIFFISLVPSNITNEKQVINLMDYYKNGKLKYTVKQDGEYELVYGILQKGHKEVMRGTPGSAGNAIDHYSKEVTLEYLEQLKKISEDTGIPLKKLLRVIFCDSIELSGGNWTDNFHVAFQKEYGYSLKPFYPFVFYRAYQGYQENKFQPEFEDRLKRVRYDYNRLIVKIYLNNFVKTFYDFAHENGLKSKYQAYGTPFHIGILEGYMIPDIPEGNNWVRTGNEPYWQSNLIWNLYAASGGHLKDRKIISNEAMTGGDFFKTSLQDLKQNDDMNFISGITHSVWNSFNYSPPEAGFPGWLWVGTWFSPQNTWWSYLNKWVEYNSRLSYVFQNSSPSKSIALLGPEGDVWGDLGLTRSHFHQTPWYLHELWKTLSQNGSSCDYLNENVICEARSENGKLIYGPMEYNALWLCSVKSLQPETAIAIKNYVKNGGKLFLIDYVPHRSLSLQNAEQNDSIVETVFRDILNEYPKQIFRVESPKERSRLMEWTAENLDQIKEVRQVKIFDPDPGLYQIHMKNEEKDIYFFTNVWKKKTLNFKAEFPTTKKIPWVWDPESGARYKYANINKQNELEIILPPQNSFLLIFEDYDFSGEQYKATRLDSSLFYDLNREWKLSFKHVNGDDQNRNFSELKEFSTAKDTFLNFFAGEVVYQTTFDFDNSFSILSLGEVNGGISEVFLNGEKVGVHWYGDHIYDLESCLIPGENKLKIVYTTVLSNYTRSLKDYESDKQFASQHSPGVRMGIEGPVRFYAKR